MKMTNAIRAALKANEKHVSFDTTTTPGSVWLVNGVAGFRLDAEALPNPTPESVADFLHIPAKQRKNWKIDACDMGWFFTRNKPTQYAQPIDGKSFEVNSLSLRGFIAQDESCTIAIQDKYFQAVEPALKAKKLQAYMCDCTSDKPQPLFLYQNYGLIEIEAIIMPVRLGADALNHFAQEWKEPTITEEPKKETKKRVPMRAGMSAKFDSAARSALKSGNQYDKAIFYDTTTTPGSVWLSNGFLCLRFDAEMLPNPTPETIADFLQIPANRRKEWRIEPCDMQPIFAKFPLEQRAYRIGGDTLPYGKTALHGFIADDNRNITAVQGKYFSAIEPMIKKDEFQAYMAAHTEEKPSPVIVTRYDAQTRAHVMEALVMPVRADEIAVCHFARQWFQPTPYAHAAYDEWFAAHGAKSAKIA